jgi:hypothetical protein
MSEATILLWPPGSKLGLLEANPLHEPETSLEGAGPWADRICISKNFDGHQTHTPETLPLPR